MALSRLAAATGLAVQDGWSPGGRVRSRGVRFANGPFLDVHGPESGEGALVLLRGRIAEAETLAALDCPGLSAGGDEGSVRIELTGADAASLRIGPVEVAFDG